MISTSLTIRAAVAQDIEAIADLWCLQQDSQVTESPSWESDSLTRKQFDFIMQRGNKPGGRSYGPNVVPKIFARFDKNNDDQLTREEANNKTSLVNRSFGKWDIDGDDILTREEITAGVEKDRAAHGASAGS